MTNYKLKTLKDKSELSFFAATLITDYLKNILNTKERVQISLSGGRTPSTIYSLLSESCIDWSRVDVFLGDERWVPHDSDMSNTKMIRNTLLAKSPGSQAIFNTVPTTDLANPEESANFFEELLLKKCSGSPPSLDLLVLGLGDDGHTASLFPGSEAIKIKNKWTAVGVGNNQERITMTHPVLSASKKVIFVVSGKSKKIALKRLLDPSESDARTPAKLVRPKDEILILTDLDAV